MAGTGNDHLSAVALKAEWEAYLGLPYSAPLDNVFEAGTKQNQLAVRALENATEPQVWVDTVSSGHEKRIESPLRFLPTVFPHHEQTRFPFHRYSSS